MSFIKYANSENILPTNLEQVEDVLGSPEVEERFKKFAKNLKAIAPKAKDFLYFSAVMMHAAEASLFDKNGNMRKDASGNDINGHFEEITDNRGTKSVKWICSDSSIFPYKNSNGDIFPESELSSAHKKWRGRPLCIDHKSSSVDHVRGLIVDTIYDKKCKRVIALCALDKKGYPDLAHKVSSGISANVSMGTAVGRAICTEHGCHRVARTEVDFCDHMRAKSGYGEINCDLAPIELSIVVNGADPDAKIKHVIAKDLSKAADNISSYIENKISTGNISREELSTLQQDLQAIAERFDKLVESTVLGNENKDDNTPYGQTRSTVDFPEAEKSNVQQGFGLPEGLSSFNSALLNDLNSKIGSLREDLEKVASFITNEENRMTQKTAYFQGGGGVNEPTPGTPKYNIEDYTTVRDTQDKQMVGQSPFPDVGPVDGMHPGPDSVGVSEEQRKKELQRLADASERRMLREAALQKIKDDVTEGKRAYFHGGGDVNEPTPGKVKYPNETDYHKIWNEDKHMVGQKPFPQVGPADGTHPGPASADVKPEMKRKQMLQRADVDLKAKFVRVANPDDSTNHNDSHWQILAATNEGDKVLLTASVDELTGGKSDAYYDKIATRDFGKRMMRTIRSEGFEQAKVMFKGAQEVAKETPVTPPDAMGPAGVPAGSMDMPEGMPEDDMLQDPGVDSPDISGLAGDAMHALEEAQRAVSDLKDAVGAGESEMEGMGDVPEADVEAELAGAAAGAPTVASLQSMRKTLNGMLTSGMRETIAKLEGHIGELKIAHETCVNDARNLTESQRKYLHVLASDSVSHCKKTLGDANGLMSAYVKYAHGTQSLLKRAAAEGTLKKEAQVMPSAETTDVKPGAVQGDPLELVPEVTLEGGEDILGAPTPERTPEHAAMFDDSLSDASADDGTVVVKDPSTASQITGDKTVIVDPNYHEASKININTKEGRAMARAKLAQTGLAYSDMLGKAHPGGSEPVANLDIKPSGDLGTVEDLEGTHGKMMDLANMPPKVRKQAEKIASLVAEGKLAKGDVDDLVRFGIDADAVKYYKQYWGEAKDSESKDFAAKLVQEHATKRAEEDQQKYQLRIKRAYDVAYDMCDRGIIEKTQIKGQVEEVMTWNDDSFNSFKRIIAQHPLHKQAAALPQVGWMASGDVMLPEGSASQTPAGVDIQTAFDSYFDGRKF